MAQKSKRIGVVVVEDEALVRMLAVDVLREAGFEVIEASNADEAVLLLQDQADQFHVLFTDLNMPGSMNGCELAHHTKQHWPWIVIIAASGKARSANDELPAESHFFQKPYDIHSVVDLIQWVEVPTTTISTSSETFAGLEEKRQTGKSGT